MSSSTAAHWLAPNDTEHFDAFESELVSALSGSLAEDNASTPSVDATQVATDAYAKMRAGQPDEAMKMIKEVFQPLKAEPSPKEFLAQEAVVAQRQLAVVKNNRARLVERYKANQQREKIMREEMAKLQSDQKALVASIRANDRAAAIQRKAIFDLQEAGR